MPIYRVQTSDGSIYRLEAPEGVSNEQLFLALQQGLARQPAEPEAQKPDTTYGHKPYGATKTTTGKKTAYLYKYLDGNGQLHYADEPLPQYHLISKTKIEVSYTQQPEPIKSTANSYKFGGTPVGQEKNSGPSPFKANTPTNISSGTLQAPAPIPEKPAAADPALGFGFTPIIGLIVMGVCFALFPGLSRKKKDAAYKTGLLFGGFFAVCGVFSQITRFIKGVEAGTLDWYFIEVAVAISWFVVGYVGGVLKWYIWDRKKLKDTQAEKYFIQAQHEINQGDVREGLWAMSYARSNGDENRTKAKYLAIRAKEIAALDEDGIVQANQDKDLGRLMAIVVIAYGIAQLVAGYDGVMAYSGINVWVAAPFIFLVLLFRVASLIVTVAAFYGAWAVWGWPWYVAALFAFPGLALLIPSVLQSLFALFKTRKYSL